MQLYGMAALTIPALMQSVRLRMSWLLALADAGWSFANTPNTYHVYSLSAQSTIKDIQLDIQILVKFTYFSPGHHFDTSCLATISPLITQLVLNGQSQPSIRTQNTLNKQHNVYRTRTGKRSSVSWWVFKHNSAAASDYSLLLSTIRYAGSHCIV